MALPVALGVTMIVMAAVTLGAWGWVELGRRNPAYEAHWPTVASRTLALFVLDSGGVGNAPWQLEAGRLLAPLATATVAINLVFTSSSERLHRGAARHSAGHRVLIGPPDRIHPYLEDHEGALTVHAIDHNDDPVDGVIRTRVDWVGADWMGAAAAGAADEIVIATSENDRNLGLLGELLTAESGRPGPDTRIMMEIDDPELVLWLSVSLASQYPESDVEIVCWPDTIARRAADKAWRATLEGPGQAAVPCVAVLGNGKTAALVAHRLAEHIDQWAGSSDAPKGRKPVLRCLGFPVPPGTFERVDIRPGRVLDDLTVDPNPDAALSVYDDLPTSYRRGAELRAKVPSCQVFVPSRTEQLLAGLNSVDMTSLRVGPQLDLDLEGPLTRVARTRYEIRSRTEGLVPWIGRWEQDRREDVRQLRLLVQVASRSDDLHLAVGEHCGPAVLPTEVTQRLRADLRETQRLGDDLRGVGLASELTSGNAQDRERLDGARDLANAPYWFATAGLSLVAQSRPAVSGRGGNQLMDDLTPEQIERLARLAHETYLRTPKNPNRDEPARRDWDDGLAQRFKESNRDAVRHKLDDLARLGYVVVARDSAAGRPRFSLDEHLEGLAEREHNRWIDFMIEAGYSVGTPRCDDTPNKAHPDLVPWEEVVDETRDKDRGPWRDFTGHLAELGLIIVHSVEPA